jgi:hypothetical protein
LLALRPELARGLRDLYRVLAGRNTFVFLSCSESYLPGTLSHEVFLVEQGQPSQAELFAPVMHMGASAGLLP